MSPRGLRPDRKVRIWSAHLGGPAAEFDLEQPIEPGEREWSNYVRGVLAGLLDAGAKLPGFDAVIHASLPAGGGLSSSAALEVAIATLGEVLSGVKLDPVKKALLCQKAEHVFAGMPCGIMDQFTVIFGQRGHLVLIDCQSLTHELVPMPGTDAALLVINTMVKHQLTDGGYASRRDDCFEAARLLGVKELRDTNPQRVKAARDILPERVFRRARHITTENERTLAAVEALRRGAWEELGTLMYASHASLRDDLEVSCRELEYRGGDRPADRGRGRCFRLPDDGRRFRRMLRRAGPHRHGGSREAAIASEYHAATGLEPAIFATRPADGPANPAPAMSEPLLSARDITKVFPGVKALAGVQLDLYRGEIHALMGENGAGKSTMIKVVTGVYPRDGGTIRFDGREIHPHLAERRGGGAASRRSIRR